MKSDSIATGIAGILFGLMAGWVIGSQQARLQPQVATPQAAPAGQASDSSAPPPALLDENQVNAFRSIAEREPSNPTPRVQLGNLYFDAQRFDDAIKWYSEGLKLAPKDADVSTDLGVAYYYTNQFDKALAQFDHSLQVDPKHVKTFLNLGVVRARGKQDLAGAQQAWEQVVRLAPGSQEAQQASRMLEAIRSAHPGTATGSPSPPGS